MFIPNGFVPSNANRQREYDAEGRLREVSYSSPTQDGGIAEASSLFATEAEQFGTISPFLKRNKAKDAQRRNYVIQPGGACIYFREDPELEDPYGGGRVQFTPTAQESFGHDSQPGGPLQGPAGRPFALGAIGDGGSPRKGGR